jgi:hypothetical protein
MCLKMRASLSSAHVGCMCIEIRGLLSLGGHTCDACGCMCVKMRASLFKISYFEWAHIGHMWDACASDRTAFFPPSPSSVGCCRIPSRKEQRPLLFFLSFSFSSFCSGCDWLMGLQSCDCSSYVDMHGTRYDSTCVDRPDTTPFLQVKRGAWHKETEVEGRFLRLFGRFILRTLVLFCPSTCLGVQPRSPLPHRLEPPKQMLFKTEELRSGLNLGLNPVRSREGLPHPSPQSSDPGRNQGKLQILLHAIMGV